MKGKISKLSARFSFGMPAEVVETSLDAAIPCSYTKPVENDDKPKGDKDLGEPEET